MSLSRKAAFLTTNFVLGLPIWFLLRSLRLFSFFDYIFLVYPGDDVDIEGFCPLWIAKSRLFSRRIWIAGIITGKKRGIILGVSNTAVEFKSNRETAGIVMERLGKSQRIIGAKSIALAGRLPGIIENHGLKFAPPFVPGVKGTLFCVMDAVDQAIKKHSLDPRARIGILGVGKIGHVLLEELVKLGLNVFGADVRPELRTHPVTGQGEVFCGDAAIAPLAEADIVVVLTTAGADFYPYLKHLKRDVIVLDDTHPMIRQRPDGITFYKVAVEMDGVSFRPKLPGYKKQWIPGCAVEAIVTANTLDFEMDQQAFNKTARELGLRATLG